MDCCGRRLCVVEKWSVRLGYCASLLVVNMKCGGEIVRAYRRVNEDVAIECRE